MSEMERKAASWVAAHSATSHKPVLSWEWWAASRFALMTMLWVPGLLWDIPCLTGSTRSPPAAGSWAWIPPLAHCSQYRNSNSKDISSIIRDFTDTHLSCCRSWCPASPPCTLPVLNAPAMLLRGLLHSQESLATSKGVYDLSLQRN